MPGLFCVQKDIILADFQNLKAQTDKKTHFCLVFKLQCVMMLYFTSAYPQLKEGLGIFFYKNKLCYKKIV